ncbi:unnamed protein product, partial [Allacma fusca]
TFVIIYVNNSVRDECLYLLRLSIIFGGSLGLLIDLLAGLRTSFAGGPANLFIVFFLVEVKIQMVEENANCSAEHQEGGFV